MKNIIIGIALFIFLPSIILGGIYLMALLLSLFDGVLGGLLVAFIPILFIMTIVFVMNLFIDKKE
jgi:hypothetical protein